MLTKKEERILKLAESGGGDKELLILDQIDALETKFDETIKEIKENVPDLNKVLESVKGKDSEVPGPKGDKGDRGEFGKDGRNGIDGKSGKDGRNGIDGQNGIDGKDGLSGKDGQNGSPDTAEQIRNKLEELKGKERLDISAIEGLEERIKEIPERPTRPIFGSGKTRVILLDLSASLDGVTKTFFIGTHLGIIGVFGSSSPFPFRPTVDYTEVGRDIVFAAGIDAAISLAQGQTLILQYLR